MNIIVDHDQAAIFNSSSSFVELVDNVDHRLVLDKLGVCPSRSSQRGHVLTDLL